MRTSVSARPRRLHLQQRITARLDHNVGLGNVHIALFAAAHPRQRLVDLKNDYIRLVDDGLGKPP